MPWLMVMAAALVASQACAAPVALVGEPTVEAVYDAHVRRLASRLAISAEAASSVWLGGADVLLAGAVSGNAWLAGADVTVQSAIAGDLWAFGGEVTLASPVGGAATLSGARVRIENAVGAKRGASIFAGAVVFDPTAQLGGDVTISAARATIAGDVGGTLRVTADDVVVNAVVAGPVRVTAQRLMIGPNARLEQGAIIDVREPLAQDPAAQVYQGVRTRAEAAAAWDIRPTGRRVDLAPLPWWTIAAISVSAGFAALALGLLAPGTMARAALIGRSQPLRAVLAGGVVMATLCGAGVLLLASLAGGLLGVAALAAAPLVVLAGLGVGAYSFGRASLALVTQRDCAPGMSGGSTWALVLASGLGGVGLAALLALPVFEPLMGTLGAGVVALWGVGVLWRGRHIETKGRRQW